ncbi:akap7 2 5 rna ligase-like domain protein [Diplodia corticola]|uniref:Akap7 2 5 rna ligase-like domain protein n=1 Tax=Diplodia corticola TaxID=236234 RepID=A0A1J9RTT6_9PEZI|nr:akap7 2 5 rna ligase-like domain protein [Diplodia corticola]OJD31839.1 akap7 2 5 rna ligase-like domain protein [Diplodia corticola]
MPRRGFGKGKGGYKGPLPGPEKSDAEGERSVTAQKPAKRPPLTHFLCLPLVTAESRPQLQASLQRFKEAVLRQEDVGFDADLGAEQDYGAGSPVRVGDQERRLPTTTSIPEKAIRPVGTLHLTLGVMSLPTPEKVDEAISLLQSLDLAALLGASQPANPAAADAGKDVPAPDVAHVNASDHSPLVISLRSLFSMHPPHKTSILYAEPEDPTRRLHSFCNALRQMFTEKGLVIEDTRPLKLHATVVNTTYAKTRGRHGKGFIRSGTGSSEQSKEGTAEASTGTSTGHGPNARAPIRLDATPLLSKYADHIWADSIHVDRVSICKMGAKKILNSQGIVVSEEYEQIASAEIRG